MHACVTGTALALFVQAVPVVSIHGLRVEQATRTSISIREAIGLLLVVSVILLDTGNGTPPA